MRRRRPVPSRDDRKLFRERRQTARVCRVYGGREQLAAEVLEVCARVQPRRNVSGVYRSKTVRTGVQLRTECPTKSLPVKALGFDPYLEQHIPKETFENMFRETKRGDKERFVGSKCRCWGWELDGGRDVVSREDSSRSEGV